MELIYCVLLEEECFPDLLLRLLLLTLISFFRPFTRPSGGSAPAAATLGTILYDNVAGAIQVIPGNSIAIGCAAGGYGSHRKCIPYLGRNTDCLISK